MKSISAKQNLSNGLGIYLLQLGYSEPGRDHVWLLQQSNIKRIAATDYSPQAGSEAELRVMSYNTWAIISDTQ